MKRAAVFGLGHFGSSVATTLYAEGLEVLAVDLDRGLVDKIKGEVSLAVSLDATNRANLEKFNVGDVDVVVVGMGTSFEASVMVTILCRELGAKKIICKALSKRQSEVLLKIGADQVVMPEEQMGHWLATNLIHDSVINLVDLPEGFSVLRVPAPDQWCGHTLAELKLLGNERVNLIQVHRTGKDGDDTRYPLPAGDFQILPGDEIDLIGTDRRLEKFAKTDDD